MGSEAKCAVHCGDVTAEGKAYLESAELTFRGGDLRLRIPLQGLKSASAADGVLLVSWGEQSARFHLGKDAEKWLAKIRNPKTVVDKIGIKAGMVVSVLGIADEVFLGQLRERVKPVPPRNDLDVVLYGFWTLDALDELASLKTYLKPNGALWTVYPKGPKGLPEPAVRAAGLEAGLVDTKVVGFSETLTAVKWVIPVSQR